MANDCLQLTDILKAEYHYIHDLYPEGVSTWLFKRDHIIDPASLVFRLKEVEKTRDPLTKRIVEELPPDARKQLEQYQKDGIPLESLQNYIVEALNNRLLTDPDLRNVERLSPDWIEEAEARAGIDLTVLEHHAHKPATDSAREMTREVTLEIMRETTDQVTIEITRETTRQPTIRETMSFNRRLLEIAYPEEIREIQNTLSAVYDHIHEKRHAALCLSGGGVRSATFCLGVIQALVRHRLLDKFHYLSTVSGGGYIGGWLSAWSNRHPEGLHGVEREMERGLSRTSISSKEPEPEPVRRLRSFSNYLTPKLGLFSGDSMALAGTYMRNLLLNWLVLVPLIAAAVIVPKLLAGLIELLRNSAVPNSFIVNVMIYGIFPLGLGLLLISVAYMGFNRPSTGYRQGGQRSFWLGGLLPMVIAALCLAGAFYGLGLKINDQAHGIDMKFWHFTLAGAGLKLVGWLMQFPARSRHSDEIRETPSPQVRELVRECLAAIGTGAFGGLVVWWVASSTIIFEFLSKADSAASMLYVCLAIPTLLLILLVTETMFVGFVSKSTTDEDREWWARAGGWVLLAAIGWAATSAMVLYGPKLLPNGNRTPGELLEKLFVIIGSLSGISTILIGKSDKTPAKKEETTSKDEKTPWWKAEWLQPMLAKWSLNLLTPIFVVFLIALISRGIDLLAQLPSWKVWGDKMAAGYPWTVLLILLSGFVMVSVVMARYIDANKFSLNSIYRSRLIRAYLGASRNYRNPNRFTGFDPEDNLQMCELGKHNSLGIEKKNLFHVLNLTLNLADGDNPAWQERKAASFTVSPLHCGNHDLGYQSSEEYDRAEPSLVPKSMSQSSNDECGQASDSTIPITLGFAMSISGAAASSNMGYYSSGPVAFLMTLFNVRLGAWLPNPGKCRDKSQGKPYPRFAYSPLLYEVLGKTNATSPYVYLSDGGHFENLGLYEMVLRRCHYIVVLDAGRDPNCTFGDLGKAVRQIRTDLGIPIEFDKMKIHPRKDKPDGQEPVYCAVGTIHYSLVDDNAENGELLYIKPVFYEEGDEPVDAYEYAKRCSDFPHESTVDQWFSESQFESYRALGHHIFEKVYDSRKKDTRIKKFFDGFEATAFRRQDGQIGQIEMLGIGLVAGKDL